MRFCLHELNNIWGDPSFYNSKLNDLIGPVCTDSRLATKGCLFIPIKGENYDGHNFLVQAYASGADAALISSRFNGHIPRGLTYWIVDDTLKAYQQLALIHRKKIKSPVIGITGSVGKTTTREILRATLGQFGSVIASEQNNNNDVGVPFTLMQANPSHSAVVIEMGMRGLGEIEKLSFCTHPDIALITNIGNAHIGRLGSRRNIAKAKIEIAKYLNSSGTLLIPFNEPLLDEVIKETWAGKVETIHVVRLKDNSIYNNPNMTPNYLGILDNDELYLSFQNIRFRLPFPGFHNAYNFMFALAVNSLLGFPLDKLTTINCKNLPGRSRCIEVGNINILDETYNASPESVHASLDYLITKPGRHFAVLGTMLELGEKSLDLHKKVISRAVQNKLDGIFIFSKGKEADAMFSIGSALPFCQVYDQLEKIAYELKSILKPGDNLLLKGSRKMGLEKLIPLLLDIDLTL